MTQPSLTDQFNTLLDKPQALGVLNGVLHPRGYQLAELTPTQELIAPAINSLPENQREACKNYLETAIKLIRQRHFVHNGLPLHDDQVRQGLPGLIERFLTGDTSLTTAETTGDQAKGKNLKEQGILQFISLCAPSTVIMSSVDMYNNYRRWVDQNGYGYCSSPTLTKYLRDSIRKQAESVSEKGRSQGWYLITP